MGGKDRFDGSGCVRPYCFGPANEAVSVPLEIVLVVFRHMLHNGAVLARAPIKPPVGRNAVVVVKHLDHISGYAHIDFLLDVFVGNLEYNFSWQRKKKGREQSPLPLIQEFL